MDGLDAVRIDAIRPGDGGGDLTVERTRASELDLRARGVRASGYQEARRGAEQSRAEQSRLLMTMTLRDVEIFKPTI